MADIVSHTTIVSRTECPLTQKRSCPVTVKKSDLVRAQADLIEQVENRSLKSTSVLFENILDSAVRKNKGGGQPWVYAAIRRRPFEGVQLTSLLLLNTRTILKNWKMMIILKIR